MKTEFEKVRVMREARRRVRMTQFNLARRVGCSESQIAKIETGRVTAADWLKEAIAGAGDPDVRSAKAASIYRRRLIDDSDDGERDEYS